ncbi:hypothetical protein [Shewanella baltica]|uniref:hypothetical protein n=1 Tax=Shewanella baltica TaxID=62322 RepID=UPI0001E1094B|nr:hypothetical protein [Shewanella baltica]AEG13351.1 hypothetical protein Sbal175_4131 [Shewanella baltica BA175]AEH12013.1 hypothetical protein Sbal117_0210 [Shewanella baltica OS117]EHQ13104.1 hypothetical protein Sbal183_0162 [Shewanella baltica OS183]MCS6235361.1 hypothetical protein [Shewanella baltica]MCS6269979.1 hypothetical protein [Shewanella baltica]
MLRPVSFAVTQRTEKISDINRTQKAGDNRQPRRVKDIKQVDKRTKKYPRLFRVKRKYLTLDQQRQFARQLNSYQLKALRDWQGFSDNLLDIKSLNDAQRWILHAAEHCEHLYPLTLRKQLKKYIADVKSSAGNMDANSSTVQQLVAYEHNLDGLLSLLALCRRYYIQE